jgi:hypothetical protein
VALPEAEISKIMKTGQIEFSLFCEPFSGPPGAQWYVFSSYLSTEHRFQLVKGLPHWAHFDL